MTTLYRKDGKRYVPIEEMDYYRDRYPEGFSLVYCQPGMTSFRFKIDPDKAAVFAAMRELLEKDLIDIISNAIQIQPKKNLATEEQNTAWNNFVKVMGNDKFAVQYDSIQGMANKVLAVIEEKALQHKTDLTLKVLK